MENENTSVKSGSVARILVIRGGAIGDFILTLPVLAALRANYPHCHLEILGYPRIASLAMAGKLADAVKPLESPQLAGFFAVNGILDPDFADYFADFQLIVSYVSDPEGVFRGNIARCSSSVIIQGRHRPDETEFKHATDVFLEALAGFDHLDPVPRLAIEPAKREEPGAWLAVHPGSGSEKKNWPEDRWKLLLSEYGVRTNLHLFLIGGEAEHGRLQRLARFLPSERCKIADHMPLPELAAAMGGCDFFVGHDSGIAHLAAAVGLPGLILWGPSNPAIWRPRSDRIKLLHAAQGLDNLTVSTVAESLHLLAGGFENLSLTGS